MALRRLSLTRGDSQTYTLTFKGGTAGTAFNLQYWQIIFTLKTNANIPDANASLKKSWFITADTPLGIYSFALDPEDTADLAPGEYDFDIKVKTSSNEIYTVMKGKFDIEYNVTFGTSGTTA
ncbi:hypothetical protein EHM76_01995 [bacterium]|nr:MAG: hypothetical protein EHM76_01995 [bacterium]